MKQLWTFISITLLMSLCSGAAAESWVKVGAADRKISLYLDTDSVRGLEERIRVSVSLLNYSRATGEPESLLAGTLHDCVSGVHRDQFVVQTNMHWGKGKQVAISGEQESWRAVANGTMGAALQRFVCDAPIKVP